MSSDPERRAEYEQCGRIDAAFRAGDLALRAAVPEAERFPNPRTPLAIGACRIAR